MIVDKGYSAKKPSVEGWFWWETDQYPDTVKFPRPVLVTMVASGSETGPPRGLRATYFDDVYRCISAWVETMPGQFSGPFFSPPPSPPLTEPSLPLAAPDGTVSKTQEVSIEPATTEAAGPVEAGPGDASGGEADAGSVLPES